MIAAWLAAAAGAGELGMACDVFSPIAGTAGFDNARAAIRTQANTYGAGEFARRRLRGLTWIAWDMHWVAGAAQVPTYCADTEGRFTQETYSQPLDLAATNIGMNVPLLSDGPLNSRAHVFYASSVTQSVMGSRALSWSLPMFNVYPAISAPVIGRTSASRGLFVYSVDWIGGAYLKSDVVSIQGGYTGRRGLYLDVTQEKIALFVNTVLDDGIDWSDAAYLMGGVQQFDPLSFGVGRASDTGEKVGMTSLFYRDLDQSDAPEDDAAETAATGEPERVAVNRIRLKTGHVRQEDVLRRFDIRAAWQLGAQARVRELAGAVHSTNWYTRPGEDRDEDITWYVRAGLVNLADQPTLGVRGGLRPTLRADYEHRVGDHETWGLRLSARMNDPDLLDLYPFAYDALGLNLEMTYTGSP